MNPCWKSSSIRSPSCTATAVQTIETFNMPGRTLDLTDMKDIPYRMTETAALYRKGSFLSLNKRVNPQDIELVLSLCKEWGVIK